MFWDCAMVLRDASESVGRPYGVTMSDSKQIWDLDVRVRDRNLKSGRITKEAVDAHLAALPDLSQFADVLSLGQPGDQDDEDDEDDDTCDSDSSDDSDLSADDADSDDDGEDEDDDDGDGDGDEGEDEDEDGDEDEDEDDDED